MAMVGIIGGSGLYEIRGFIRKRRKKIITPFGKPSDDYLLGHIGNVAIIFLPRHGSLHNIPPHMINYRANMWGFKKLGAERIISVSAVGGIRKGYRPGDIVVLDQIIDMTRNREVTFYNGKNRVVHVDFTKPFCPEMRRIILKAGRRAKIKLKDGATYVAAEGPRLETAAEIRAFGIIGSDVVGMTGMPEASLARELELCYSGISVVANYAAGITKNRLTTTEVLQQMKASTKDIKRLLEKIFSLLPEQRTCLCKETLKEAMI